MIKQILLLITFSGIFISKAQQAADKAYTVTSGIYEFKDSDRINRIEKALPVADKLFKQYAEGHHFPGMVYGIVADGKLIFTGTYGHINLEQKTPVSDQSAFRIASMTKSFTAMAILKLRDEGKLNLDDPAYLYIPELKFQHFPSTDAPSITIRHLLSHNSGFPEDNPWGDRQLANTDQQLLTLISKGISFSNDPGISYEYSNLGFTLLGYIIKKVTGLSYEQYITENILKPLGMDHTYWEYSNVPANILAHGYRFENNKWTEQPFLHDGAYGAMGGMITTIGDFSKYVAFQLSACPPSDLPETGPIRRSSVREMQHPWNISGLSAQYHFPDGRSCPVVSAYAYGLRWMEDCDQRIWVGHTGGLPGFGSNWNILPGYGIGIISFANLTYAPTAFINLRVLDTLVSLAHLKPRQLNPSSILITRQHELMNLLPDWRNAQISGVFASNFFLDYSIDSLKKETKNAFTMAGKIIHVHQVIPENQLRGSFIIEGEKANIIVSFTLTPENPALIQAYDLKLYFHDYTAK